MEGESHWLVVILVINAAVSAGYYLRIVGSMFLSTETPGPRFRQQPASDKPVHHPMPVLVSVGISMAAVLWFGIVFPATLRLATRAPPRPTSSRPEFPRRSRVPAIAHFYSNIEARGIAIPRVFNHET